MEKKGTGMNSFYKQLTPLYHLIFQDWDTAIEDQGRMMVENLLLSIGTRSQSV